MQKDAEAIFELCDTDFWHRQKYTDSEAFGGHVLAGPFDNT